MNVSAPSQSASSAAEPATSASASERYGNRIASLKVLVDGLRKKENLYSRSRGILFIASILCAVIGFNVTSGSVLLFLLAAVLFVVFVAAVGIFEHTERSRKTEQLRMELQEQQLARFHRNWERVPVPKVIVPEVHLAKIRDLDLISKGGLYHFLCRAHTRDGRRCYATGFWRRPRQSKSLNANKPSRGWRTNTNIAMSSSSTVECSRQARVAPTL